MPLTDSLISYWKLDESSGDALDAHGTNDLTDNNTVGSASGKINGARDFEAANGEYFSRADNAGLSTGDIDFTFAAWVNAESLSGFPVVANKGWAGSGGGREWILYYRTDASRFRFAVENETAEVDANTLGAASTGTWYHVVCWHDSVNNQIGIAVNGGSADTAAYSGGVTDAAGDFRIGASPTQSLYWDGLIDEAGFWKRVLSSAERLVLYNGGSGLAYPFATGAAAPRPRRARGAVAEPAFDFSW
jgi:Concanavalin A-like lectin/glucanases superfamily